MKPKNFLVIGQLPPPVHGSNVMMYNFVKSLRELGYETDVVQKTFTKNLLNLERGSFLKIGKIPVIGLRLLRLLVTKKYDACFYFISVGLTSLLIDICYLSVLRLFRVPYILYCQGKGLGNIKLYGFLPHISVIRKTISNAIGAIVLGQRLKRDLTPYLNSKRILVIPNTIIDNYKYVKRMNKEIKVLFLANLIKEKGPMEFLEMAKEITNSCKQVQFILGGPVVSETFYKELENYIKKECLDKLVKITGGIYNNEKHKLFQDSNIFVFPTYYKREASPLVILEAMKSGLPIISSFEGAIPEMVIDGVNGFLVDPKDINKMSDITLRLINNNRLMNEMGEKSQIIFERKYSFEEYKKRVIRAINIFEKLM